MNEVRQDFCSIIEDGLQEIRKKDPSVEKQILYLSHLNKINKIKIESYEKMLDSLLVQVESYEKMVEVLEGKFKNYGNNNNPSSG